MPAEVEEPTEVAAAELEHGHCQAVICHFMTVLNWCALLRLLLHGCLIANCQAATCARLQPPDMLAGTSKQA